LKSLFILYLSLISFLHSEALLSQHNFGALSSNYTPTTNVYINPTSISNSKTWLDINFIGLDIFLNNSLVYLYDQSILNAIQGKYETSILFDTRRKNTALFAKTFVAGPSFTLNFDDHAFGIGISNRSYIGVQKIPQFMARFIQNGISDYSRQHGYNYQLSNVKIAAFNFSEITASYSYTFFKKRKELMIGGLTFKKLYSTFGAAANISDASFNVRNEQELSLFNFNTDLMLSRQARFDPKGGFGLDLGFTYQKMTSTVSNYKPHTKAGGCNYTPYKYKIGISIIDIGRVKFAEESINYAGYNFGPYEWQNYDSIQLNQDNQLDYFMIQEENINMGNVTKPTNIQLPTFLSVQFDYNLLGSVLYINSTIVQGIPSSMSKFGIRHANSFSLTPRIETKWLDFALPFSLYEYKQPQLGLSLRLGPIVIGSDKLVNWLINTDVYGANFYFHAKIPLFSNPSCKEIEKRKSKFKKKVSNGLKCSF